LPTQVKRYRLVHIFVLIHVHKIQPQKSRLTTIDARRLRTQARVVVRRSQNTIWAGQVGEQWIIPSVIAASESAGPALYAAVVDLHIECLQLGLLSAMTIIRIAP
jgi:hypothetical protein